MSVVGFFKGRDAARRLPTLVAQAASANLAQSGGSLAPRLRLHRRLQLRLPSQLPRLPLRTARLLLGYDTWSRTERLGMIAVSIVLCAAFGWDDGGPFAAALFVAVAVVNATLALVALAARATSARRRA